jgi:hypothetical protein
MPMLNQNQWDSMKPFYRPVVRRYDCSSLSRGERWQAFQSIIESNQTPLGLELNAVVKAIGMDQTHCNEVIEHLERRIQAEREK